MLGFPFGLGFLFHFEDEQSFSTIVILLILSEVTYLPSFSSQKDSAYFVARTPEEWRYSMPVHHLGQNEATFLKAN